MKLWTISNGVWSEERNIVGATAHEKLESLSSRTNRSNKDGTKGGEVWAIALSENGHFLASTTQDGRINIWDNEADSQKIREYSTLHSFGLALDLVCQRHLVAAVLLMYA